MTALAIVLTLAAFALYEFGALIAVGRAMDKALGNHKAEKRPDNGALSG